MQQRVGTCSLCGGDVMGYRGAWFSIDPPPPDECASCGARRVDDVIDMRQIPNLSASQQTRTFTSNRTIPWPKDA